MSASSAFWGVSSGSARASRPGVTSDMVRSADVLLHHVGIARMRLRRIAAELAQRAALAQEIPALIELGLHLREALAFLGRELATLEETVLFTDQCSICANTDASFSGLAMSAPRGFSTQHRPMAPQ